jgi:hypothetical protein
MANSKLLKEAIADAKAVKETALANAKLALEEAFTPRLQSILAQKLQAEAEKESEEEMQNEELKSSEVGQADTSGHNPGKVPTLKADTEVEAGEVKKTSTTPAQINHDYTKTKDISENWEEEGKEESVANEIAALQARLAELQGMGDEEEANHFGQEEESYEEEGDMSFGNDDKMDSDDMDMDGDDDQMGDDDQDDMDLEAIIRELEQQLEGSDEEEEEGTMYESEEEEEEESKNESYSDGSDAGTDKSEDPKVVMNNEGEDVTKASGKAPKGSFDKDSISEDVIDLEEILREMEKDMKDDKKEEEEAKNEAALNEAYATIKSLQKTINEVNLLNAKLLFANKLFRAHNMTNEQKVKVIETLDRTNSVREVKLVYATLAENFRYSTPTQKSVKKSITEGIASKVVNSTAPKAEAKQVIAESADFADRFKKLAGIIK